ncbi:MAG: EscU/YscU/HrcU family type III secretion system export apparatus switch protein [candidate division KSB1 bacterium]|nr:EscU/YscU/HrcU family type III secretion system export apparatus switch protein [candidate division KSB1 bacterium]
MKQTSKGAPLAVALKYKQEQDNAPKVIAKGRGYLAEKIIEIAQAQGIPIEENAALVDKLIQLELDEEIPPELYQVIAEILAFVYKMRAKWEAGDGPS